MQLRSNCNRFASPAEAWLQAAGSEAQRLEEGNGSKEKEGKGKERKKKERKGSAIGCSYYASWISWDALGVLLGSLHVLLVCYWDASGSVGASWGALGALLGHSWGALGCSWGASGVCWDFLGCSWVS